MEQDRPGPAGARVRAVLGAGGAGAVIGVACLCVERLLAEGAPWRLDPVTLYATLGGGALAVWTAVLPARRRARGIALGSGLMCVPTVVFVVNAVVLAGDPWHSARSLAATIVAIALTLAAARLAGRGAERLLDRPGPQAAAGSLGVAWLAAAGLVAWSYGDPPRPPRGTLAATGPDIVLIVADSVRADRLGLYGHPGVAGPTSPRLDARAASARVFERAYSASSWTGPSVQGLLAPDWQLRDIPATLGAAGYATACFSDNPNLSPRSVQVEKFQTVRPSVPSWRFALAGTLAARVLDAGWPPEDARLVQAAARWWRSVAGPRFLYVHLMDSHTPFARPPLDGRPSPGRRFTEPSSGMSLRPEEAADLVARYEAGVHSAIAAAMDLVESVESSRPLVILTADHGESLGEEGRWFHGRTLAPELLAVPLVVLGPGVRPGRVAEVVGADAVAATVLRAALGRCDPCPALDLREGTPPGVAEGGLPPDLLYRIRDGHRVVVDRSTRQLQLFDLAVAPGVDVAAAWPERARQLATRLNRRFDPPLPPADALERLRALGYIAETRPTPP